MKIKGKKLIKIGIIGVAGRMGRSITKLAMRDSEISLCGGIEHTKHKLLGKDIGELLGENAQMFMLLMKVKDFLMTWMLL